MALPNSGPIAFNMLNMQLYRPEMQQISLNDTQVRGLAGKPSGAIGLDDLRGKYAGAKLTSAQISSDVFGFQLSPLRGELAGFFGGVSMEQVTWMKVSASGSLITLVTVSGAAQPTATEIVVRGPNFEPILQLPIGAWSLSSGVWVALVVLTNNTLNPFPVGSTRWIS